MHSVTDLTKLTQQIEFIAITDRLKGVLRKTKPIGEERRENSAEHSWQVMLSAIVLAEHANEKIDLLKVLKMLAVHDIPEIIIGDTFHYAKTNTQEVKLAELEAAKELFSTLPPEQQKEFLELFKEFEEQNTPESKFASSLDRLMAFIHNPRNNGGTWAEYALTVDAVNARTSQIQNGSTAIWDYVSQVIDQAKTKGHLK
jgi:putative hydrolase of HD superfamily